MTRMMKRKMIKQTNLLLKMLRKMKLRRKTSYSCSSRLGNILQIIRTKISVLVCGKNFIVT